LEDRLLVEEQVLASQSQRQALGHKPRTRRRRAGRLSLTKTHSSFYVLLKSTNTANDKILDKFREYRDYKDDYYHNVLFISTLRKFLKLVRILSFTKPM